MYRNTLINRGEAEGSVAMFRRTILAGVLLLTGVHSAIAETSASPPEEVVAFTTGTGGWVTWAPPSQGGADFYRVYGVSGGTRYLIQETTTHHAGVAGSYSGYAVSAVKGGVESTAVGACAVYVLFPPPNAGTSNCI